MGRITTLLAVLFFLFCSVALFATGGKETAIDVDQEPITLEWMLLGNLLSSATDLPVVLELEKRLNMKFETTVINYQQYEEKQNVIIASQDMPDLMTIQNYNNVRKYGSEGAFVDYNQYINLLPNFKKWKDKYPVDAQMADADGRLYGTPIIYDYASIGEGYIYRKDVFEKLDIGIWESYEDFYTALKILKTAYPDSYPYMSRWRLWHFMSGLGGTNDIFRNLNYDYKSKNWEMGCYDPNFKMLLEFINRIYKEGLMDPECLTMPADLWTEKLLTSKAFVTFDYFGQCDDFTARGRKIEPEYTLAVLPPWKHNEEYGKVDQMPNVVDYRSRVISNKSEYIEEALRLTDYLYSDEGIELLNWGIEGFSFNWEGDKRVLSSNLKTATNPGGTLDPITDVGIRQGLTFQGVMPFDSHADGFGPIGKEALSLYSSNYAALKSPLVFSLNNEELEKANVIAAPLDTYIDEQTVMFILGDRSFDEWDEFINKVKEFKADELVDIYNEALNRYQ